MRAPYAPFEEGRLEERVPTPVGMDVGRFSPSVHMPLGIGTGFPHPHPHPGRGGDGAGGLPKALLGRGAAAAGLFVTDPHNP